MEVTIALLDRTHDRTAFDCGVKELNTFLAKHAFQNQKNFVSKTFVAIAADEANLTEKTKVLGFYTLATGCLKFDTLPEAMKHPKYPVSIARLARLATDLQHQGKGIGGFLLYDALQKIKMASELVGIYAVVVDAKDEKAKSFYQRYGFVSLQESALTLCLPMKILDQLY